MGLRGITGSLPCRPKGGARALDDQRLGRKPPALSRPQSLRPTCLHPSLPFPSLLRVGFLESGLKLQDKSWAFSPRPPPTPSPAIQLGGSPPSRHRWPSCAGWSPACWGRIRTGEHSLGGSTHAGEHSLGEHSCWAALVVGEHSLGSTHAGPHLWGSTHWGALMLGSTRWGALLPGGCPCSSETAATMG